MFYCFKLLLTALWNIDDVGKSALYLLSDLGSGVTREILHVDSGYHIVGMKAVDAPDSLMYTVVFAMSNNYWNIFSLDKARKVLGYEPQDDAGKTLNLDRELPVRDNTEYKQHEEDPDTY